ncbi:MAG: DUF1667 domain-containing protein [Eubacteriales bacterium]|nr:DUF1667 domain-containing protein [Eubacteriales bacterium]
MEEKKLICIGCPLGCPLTVTMKEGSVISVAGNTCPRGDAYARKEVTDPTRIVTSTVKITGSTTDRYLPVKTASDIPKGKIFDCMKALVNVAVEAPVHVGDVIVADVAGTGVNIVASKTILNQ